MGKNVVASGSSRPDVELEAFIKNLNVFIAQSSANLQKMRAKHKQMSAFWKGDQYDKFTAILEATIKDAAKELLAMQNLKEDLSKKLMEMRRAMAR